MTALLHIIAWLYIASVVVCVIFGFGLRCRWKWLVRDEDVEQA